MTHPRIFVSYSHDSPDHKAWVRVFVERLRSEGCDVIHDESDLRLGRDVMAFMDRAIASADRVLLICTDQYVEKADGRSGGVGVETAIVTGELVEKLDSFKFVPVIRQSGGGRRVPHYLGSRRYVDFSDDAAFSDQFARLLRDLKDLPLPGVRGISFSSQSTTVRSVAVSPDAEAGARAMAPLLPDLDEPWFGQNVAKSESGLVSTKRRGGVAFRSRLHAPVNASQLSLLDGVRKAEIRTFGWPIAVLLEGREEFRPRPMAEGIAAEITIHEGRGDDDDDSYDFWAARTDGAFFHCQNLFEDQRKKGAVFFNTRIVRAAESLLFLNRFYSALGATPDVGVSAQFRHFGLAGRALQAVGNRHILPQTSSEDAVDTRIDTTVGGLDSDTAVLVEKLLSPVFMLFNFSQFGQAIYDDIVSKFKSGHVT